MVEYFPIVCQALGFIPSINTPKRNKHWFSFFFFFVLTGNLLVFMCMSVCTVCILGTHQIQKRRMSDSSELNFTDGCEPPHSKCWEPNQVLFKTSQCSEPLSHSSSSTFLFHFIKIESHSVSLAGLELPV